MSWEPAANSRESLPECSLRSPLASSSLDDLLPLGPATFSGDSPATSQLSVSALLGAHFYAPFSSHLSSVRAASRSTGCCCPPWSLHPSSLLGAPPTQHPGREPSRPRTLSPVPCLCTASTSPQPERGATWDSGAQLSGHYLLILILTPLPYHHSQSQSCHCPAPGPASPLTRGSETLLSNSPCCCLLQTISPSRLLGWSAAPHAHRLTLHLEPL